MTETEEEKQIRYKKRNTKEEWLDKTVLTESEVLLLKNRLCSDTISVEEIFKDENDQKLITKEHSDKGLKWLMNLHETPKGRIRKNNPFSVNQIKIIENFDHFTLDTFYCVERTCFRTIYAPLWKVHSKDGSSFWYWNMLATIHIL